ncbi:hypothetical protein K3N28_06385 [Glycomyces sp. TRM65418]|uniref:hypothetical protein n=1 Tax=Glycomyces sp. TRM65418 TaxID=2867006 RepID=UPI001CE55C6B|nr:hypothetical protein [Glycomyces sp. TRM65418]MCC3762696.1 hypothetical protein [Glycomyces sp. TRM65418]QZD56731.1 hypothetical protein K3N28_06335 [Glycomyces sp. TRM65418]
MVERSPAEQQPKVEHFGQLMGTVLAYFVMGAAVLVVIDLVFVIPSGRGFGQTSGWIAALPTVWVYTEQFRRYAGAARWGLMAVGVLLGLAAGLAVTIVAPATWLPMYSGGLGGLAAALVYGALWYAGIKAFGEERSA